MLEFRNCKQTYYNKFDAYRPSRSSRKSRFSNSNRSDRSRSRSNLKSEETCKKEMTIYRKSDKRSKRSETINEIEINKFSPKIKEEKFPQWYECTGNNDDRVNDSISTEVQVYQNLNASSRWVNEIKGKNLSKTKHSNQAYKIDYFAEVPKNTRDTEVRVEQSNVRPIVEPYQRNLEVREEHKNVYPIVQPFQRNLEVRVGQNNVRPIVEPYQRNLEVREECKNVYPIVQPFQRNLEVRVEHKNIDCPVAQPYSSNMNNFEDDLSFFEDYFPTSKPVIKMPVCNTSQPVEPDKTDNAASNASVFDYQHQKSKADKLLLLNDLVDSDHNAIMDYQQSLKSHIKVVNIPKNVIPFPKKKKVIVNKPVKPTTKTKKIPNHPVPENLEVSIPKANDQLQPVIPEIKWRLIPLDTQPCMDLINGYIDKVNCHKDDPRRIDLAHVLFD